MNYTLSATTRTTRGEKVRYSGQLPAVMYGAGTTAQSLALGLSDFIKLYRQAGESTLIDLLVDGKDSGKVLVQDVQHDPVKDQIIHVDLRRIDMKKAMTAPVTLKFIGEAPVIKAQGGTMVTTVQTVEVKCLPKDLVSHIDVDLSSLTSFDITIKIKDIKLPAGIQIISPHAEDLVAKAAPALTEEQIKAMEEANAAPVDLAKIATVADEKKAEEAAKAAAEGEGAAEAKKDEKKDEKTAKGGKEEKK